MCYNENMPIFTEYDDGSDSHKRHQSFRARLSERRKINRRKLNIAQSDDHRTGMDRRFNFERRFILKHADSIIKVRSPKI